MLRLVVAVLFVLALYHAAKMAEAYYSLRKDIDLQKSKLTDEERKDPSKLKAIKDNVIAANEKTFVHHCIWGGPFIWIVAIPLWWISKNEK